MKKLMKSLMLFAAAAMALTSCQNEEMDSVQENEAYTMNFVAGAPESRTSVEVDGTTATFAWAESGETFTFVQNTTAGLKKGTNVTFANNAGLAEITATFTEADSPIVAIYPEDAWVDNTDDFNKAKLIVAKDQNILDGTFDPNADLLVSKVVEPENATDTHSLQFGRVVAIGKMALKNLPVVGSEVINKVNFSIDSENALTGRLYIDLETAEVSEWGYYNNAYKEVNLKDGNMAVAATNDIYFTCMPATVAAGETFTVVVTTNAATYTHSVTIPEGKAIQFSAGRVSSFGVNMAEAERVVNSGLSLPWSESFDSEDLSKYDIVNGSSDTKVYPDGNLAKGEAGEILIGKEGGSFSATFASDGTAKTLNLWFKSNKDFIEVSSATEGVTITKLTSTGYTVALAEGVQMFKLTLTNNNSKDNARVDDIVLTTEAPAIASLAIANQTISFTVGGKFVFDGTVSAVYENGVVEEVTGYNVDSSKVDMATAGNYDVTITYNGVSATYSINVADASIKTTEATLSFANKAQRTSFSTSTQVWEQNGITFTNNKGTGSNIADYANPVRLYQNSSVTIEAPGNITKIVFTANSGSYATALKNSIGTEATASGSTVTVIPVAGASTYTIAKLSAQVRLNSLTVTYVDGGTGTDTPEAADQTLSFSQTTASATVGQDFTEPTLSGAMTTVTYTSSNAAVATVDANTGAVTLVGAGETTITATAEETKEYKSATASYTLTVTAAGSSEGGNKTYTLQFGASYNSKGVSSYTSEWSATCNDFTWNIVNANNNNNGWSYIKMGNKSSALVGKITTSTVIPEAISTVTMTVDAVTTSAINSIKLYVATDAGFTANLQTISVTAKTGNLEFSVPTPTANCYYKIEVDCKVASKNGPIQISKVVYE